MYDQKNLIGGLRLPCLFVLLLSCVLMLVFNFSFYVLVFVSTVICDEHVNKCPCVCLYSCCLKL